MITIYNHSFHLISCNYNLISSAIISQTSMKLFLGSEQKSPVKMLGPLMSIAMAIGRLIFASVLLIMSSVYSGRGLIVVGVAYDGYTILRCIMLQYYISRLF